MNYSEIKSYVRQQTHRSDLTDAQFDSWTNIIHSRVVRDARFRGQIKRTTITPATNPVELPDDVDEVLSIWTTVTDTAYQLRKTSTEEFRLLSLETGYQGPVYYCLHGSRIEFSPNSTGVEYTLEYRAEVAKLVADTDSNELSTDHPEVYVYAYLREVYFYLRDFDAVAAAQETYNSEIDAIRARHLAKDSGNNPEMSGASRYP